MNPATVRLALTTVQALIQLGITAQRISDIAQEAERNGGHVTDATVKAVEDEVQRAQERWDTR